ncbi:MAG: Gfo/Idh/MocA family oxidoreductase [Oscillospiraceae bacterium]|nr:Gfo/Idh/MocA family oxidoreductase [Oscillospiraceae bacterium]
MSVCTAKKDSLDAFKFDQTETAVDTSKRVRVGIIGTGWIAGNHVREYLKMPDVDIVAGADLVPGKAEGFFASRGIEGVKCYPSHKELIDSGEVDAVSICTYNATHAECAIYALEHGVHVLLEKPMCVTTEEAVAICKAEKASGKVLSLGFQPRFDNSMQMVRDVVQSGVLGRIYYIQTGGGRRRGIPAPFGTTFIEKETGGIGALGDIGCYSLDMVLSAIGYPKPLTVTGYTSDYFGKDPQYWLDDGKPAEYADKFGVDDFAAGFVRLEGGIMLDFRISWAAHWDTPGDTLILGTKGGLRIPSTECWNGSIGGPLKLYQTVAGREVVTEFPVPDRKPEPNFYYKVRSFLDAVKNGTPAPVPSSQILYNQAILDAINESAKLGREIEVSIPEI